MLVGHVGTQAVAFFAGDEEQSNIFSFAAQALGGGDLRGDDSFGVACAAAVDSRLVFGGRDVGRNGIHVRGKPDGRLRLLGGSGVYVEAVGFDRHFLHLIAETCEFSVEIVSDFIFVAGDRLDVDHLAGEGDGIHGGEDSKSGVRARAADFGPWTSGFGPSGVGLTASGGGPRTLCASLRSRSEVCGLRSDVRRPTADG
jgi:hypothetical protein